MDAVGFSLALIAEARTVVKSIQQRVKDYREGPPTFRLLVANLDRSTELMREVESLLRGAPSVLRSETCVIVKSTCARVRELLRASQTTMEEMIPAFESGRSRVRAKVKSLLHRSSRANAFNAKMSTMETQVNSCSNQLLHLISVLTLASKIQENQEAARETQDAVGEPQDAIRSVVRESQDAIRDTARESQDAVRELQDTVRKTRDAVREIQDAVRDTARETQDAVRETQDANTSCPKDETELTSSATSSAAQPKSKDAAEAESAAGSNNTNFGEGGAGEDSGSAEWVALTEDELSEPIELSEAKEPRSLHDFVREAGKVLCFVVINDEKKHSIILQQTGNFDWWNRLNPKVSVGYKTVGKVETEPRLKRLCIECESLSGLRQALRDLRKARMSATFAKKSTKEAAKDIGSWELASAIVVVQTVRSKVRVRGKYVRWCERDMKSVEGFKVDMPVCVKAGIAVDVDCTTFMVKVDDGTRLNFCGAGLVSGIYNNEQLICAQSLSLVWADSGEVNELQSRWKVSTRGLPSNGGRRLKEPVSKKNLYLH